MRKVILGALLLLSTLSFVSCQSPKDELISGCEENLKQNLTSHDIDITVASWHLARAARDKPIRINLNAYKHWDWRHSLKEGGKIRDHDYPRSSVMRFDL